MIKQPQIVCNGTIWEHAAKPCEIETRCNLARNGISKSYHEPSHSEKEKLKSKQPLVTCDVTVKERIHQQI